MSKKTYFPTKNEEVVEPKVTVASTPVFRTLTDPTYYPSITYSGDLGVSISGGAGSTQPVSITFNANQVTAAYINNIVLDGTFAQYASLSAAVPLTGTIATLAGTASTFAFNVVLAPPVWVDGLYTLRVCTSADTAALSADISGTRGSVISCTSLFSVTGIRTGANPTYYPVVAHGGSTLAVEISGGVPQTIARTLTFTAGDVTAVDLNSLTVTGTFARYATLSAAIPLTTDPIKTFAGTASSLDFNVVLNPPVWVEGNYDIKVCSTQTSDSLSAGLVSGTLAQTTSCTSLFAVTSIRMGTYYGYSTPEEHARLYINGEI